MAEKPKQKETTHFEALQQQVLNRFSNIKERVAQGQEKKHESLERIGKRIDSIRTKINSSTPTSRRNVNDTDFSDDEIPEFIKNHAEEKGMSINEILAQAKNKANELEQDSGGSGPKDIKKATVDTEKDGTTTVVAEKLLTKNKIKNLDSNLKQRVFGQDETIEEVVDILKMAALNIKINKEKPAGVYLFAGPSGVGKTELAQAIADNLEVPILKIDMGEFGQEQDVSKLIGAAAGLVGYKEGGLLTNFVKENPRSVILFDELEKADPTIDKIMLSIMDHGTCRANDGTIVSFKETIVISTSNLGAEVEYQTGLEKSEKNKIRMDFIKEGLRPEIINRYDSIFHLNSLSLDIYKKVAEKFLNKLTKSIKEEHNFDLKLTPALVDFIVEKSYDPAMGGRPARKFIEKIVMKPLVEFMLEDNFDDLVKTHKDISIDLNKDQNIFFKGKNRKVLGVLENTAELVSRVEEGKFTNKPKP